MEQEKGLYHVGTLTYTRRQLAAVLFWLLWGDVCYMLMESVVPSILPVRLEQLGASNTAVGWILTTIPMLINSIANPIISFKSDRYRSKLGRRIPFILFTLPFLVICLIGLGYADKIGFWVHAHYGSSLGHFSQHSIAVISIGVFMVAFSFFNTFLNSVFWYLFNDVVPEHLLARFMSWFRLISMASASLYNLFIFKYAGTHSTEIFLGAGILYFVGFGLMCLNVKEGDYPPSPEYVDGKSGPFSAIKTFIKECHTLKHYWYQFLTAVLYTMGICIGVFMLYFYESTGLNLDQIGKINGYSTITIGLLIPFSGWLADRYHPIRVVIVGYLMQILIVLPASMVWFFWHPSPNVAYWIWIAIVVVLTAPAGALMGV